MSRLYYESPTISHLTHVQPNGFEDLITVRGGVFTNSGDQQREHEPLAEPDDGLYVVSYGVPGLSLSVRREGDMLVAIASQLTRDGKVHKQVWGGSCTPEIVEGLITVNTPTLPIWVESPDVGRGLLRGFHVTVPGCLDSAYLAELDDDDRGCVYDAASVTRHIELLEVAFRQEAAELREHF